MTANAETARRLLGLIDLTSLNDGHDDDIAGLCAAALTPHGPVAAVCSWPEFTVEMARGVAGRGPRVATVVNFPGGDGPLEAAVAEAGQAVEDGADELDLVWPYRAWMAGERRMAVDLVRAVKQAAGPARLKVILETGVLADPEVIAAASRDVIAAGADMLKTSTGKNVPGADLPAAEVMLRAIRASGRAVGFKAAGGIRTLGEAAAYLSLAEDIMGPGWATADRFRIGASRLLDEILGRHSMSGFLPQETIRRKRDGEALTEAEIAAFVRGMTDGAISEGQTAAFAMAVFFRGLSADESVALTRAMTRSGRILAWPDLGRPVLDKHSTGGVGDKVSLVLAPILAACGAAVPMISGRGLGHTGGTLDKLDSIPGYDTSPDLATFRRALAEAHCAIVGQTDELAPADRRLYAIRDVTATVESIPLITASILSKKLAAGLEGLVMDVKTGSGAFMTSLEGARALAESIVGVATGAGLPTRALITDMNQVLGRTAGNALELREALDYLTGAARDPRFHEVVLALSSELLVLGGLAADADAATALIGRALDGGAAAEAFQRMCAALGGPSDILESAAQRLPTTACVVPIHPKRSGFVTTVETRQVGLCLLGLGGGRVRADQGIDHAVGLSEVAAIGTAVGSERPLALVHARSGSDAEDAAAALRRCYEIDDEPPARPPVVLLSIGPA